jgi:CDP-glucose 4,6-dehydratase
VNFRAYRGRRVLVTGHTGFKGSWLTLWLDALGAKVAGVALPPPTKPSHWELLGLDIPSETLDIRDAARVRACVAAARPEIVFHLAAQSLVRRSYADPLETWSTNVLGTANVLDACRAQPGLKAIVVVTTDKCYENREWTRGYRETDRLGGHDAYSASKAGAELVAVSYRKAFFHERAAPLLATARSGNVIGGGDWSQDRLVPDLARALASGTTLEIRSPRATRPWLHVLEPLAGYLNLGERLLNGERGAAEAWNFGPDRSGNLTVGKMLDGMRRHWPELAWKKAAGRQPHEARLLHLDSSKARRRLGWKPLRRAEESIAMTAEWYRAYLDRGEVVSRRQLADYQKSLAGHG